MSEEVTTFENHAQDSRVREIDVSDTRSQKDGTGGNNLPLVLATFGKVGHAVNADGDGEKYAEVEVAQTLNTFQNQCEGRAVELCVDVFNQQGSEGTPHAVAVRTANTHANGHGIADEATHTLDRASGQAVCVGSATEESCMTLRSAMTGTDGNNADPKVVTNGVATMLKVRCGKDTYTKPDGSTGTAGKGPLTSEESAFTLAATQDQTLIQQVNTILEDNHANATKTNPGEILRVLREALGEKAFEEWAARIAAPLWTKEVLRHEVHGEGIRREACEAELGQVNGALALSEDGSAGALRDVRQAECDRCSPQGRELSQQHDGELDSPVSQLSHQGSPQAEVLQDLWRTDEGARVLREALSALQEIRRSASVEAQPTHAFNLTHIVRRLTPIECERLMALPDNYTRIPYRGKPADQCPDSPRYKALGNSWATNCAEWILRRIVAAVRLGLIPEEERQ